MSDKDLIYAFEEAYNASLGSGRVTLSTTFMEQMLEIVKEKQPVKPTYRHVYTTKGYFCGACDKRLNREGKYCCFCGTPVDWE